MYENQFIQFTQAIDPLDSCMPLPVVFGGSGINFFVPVFENPKTLFTIVDASGVPFKNGNGEELSGTPRSMEGNWVSEMFGIKNSQSHSRGYSIFSAEESRDFVAPNECFRIRIGIPKSEYKEWGTTTYPYKNDQTPADVMRRLGLSGTIGTQVIPTVEVATQNDLQNIANPQDDTLYYTQDAKEYYIYYDGFHNVTDSEEETMLFGGDTADNLMLLKTKTKDELIDYNFNVRENHLLTCVSRVGYAKLHITGNYTRGGSFNNTGGRIIAKYIGMNPYNATTMRNAMTYASTHGGFDIENVTAKDARTLETSGFEFTLVSMSYKHTFNHEVFWDNSVNEQFIYSADQIAYVIQQTEYKFSYSNLLRRYENPNGEFALLSYTCDTETFGLPFTTSRPVRQWLPIWLNKPKYNQKDEIYEKLSGERVVLFATINKELNAQTDYIPESWHERIVLALSCDEVRVNGVKLTKSDNYDIDWDNHTENDCGVWLARATWKMAANVTSRNSNN